MQELFVKISSDFKGLNQGFNEAFKNAKLFSDKMEGLTAFGEGMKTFGATMGAFVTLPLTLAGAASIKLASDMVETTNKVGVAFGQSADDVMEWSKTSITSMGLAQQSALDAAALFGDMGTAMGISRENAADMSMSLTQLGADLASYKNIGIQQAMDALRGVFTGETESLTTIGYVMTETNLAAFALSKGITKNIQDMTQAEKVNLRYAFILQATKDAQGDFARNNQEAAAQMRMFGELMKQLGVSIGTIILPIFNEFAKKANNVLLEFANMSDGMKKTIIVVAGFAAALGPLAIGIGGLLVALPLMKSGFLMTLPAIKAVGVALRFLALNPIGLVISAVGGLVLAGIYLYKNWDTARIRMEKIAVAIGYRMEAALSQAKIAVLYSIDKILQGLGKFVSFIPVVGDKIESARAAISSMIDEQTVKKQSSLLKNKIEQNVLNYQLLRAETEKAKREAEELAAKTKDSAAANAKYDDGIKQLMDSIAKSTSTKKEATKAEGAGKKAIDETTEATKKAAEAEAERSKQQYENTVTQLDKLGGAVVEALRRRYAAEEKAESDNLKEKKRGYEKATKETLEKLKKDYDDQVRALKNKNRQEIESIRDAQKEKFELINAETKDKLKAVQDEIDAIENSTRQEEKQLEEQAYNTRIAELQKEILTAKSADERLRAQAKLDEEIQKRQRELLLEERKAKIAALQEDMKNIQDSADFEKKTIEERNEAQIKGLEKRLEDDLIFYEDKYIADEKAYQDALEQMNEYYDDELEKTQEKFQKLTTEESLFAEARILMLKENQDDMVKLLNEYNPKWQDAGQSFGQSMLNGLNSMKSSIQQTVNEIMGMVGKIENEKRYLQGLIEQGKATGNTGLVNWAKQQGSLLGVPFLADGGIITSPTLAMVGEAGTEAVIPLNRLGDFGGAKETNIYLDGRKITGVLAPTMVDMIRGRVGSAY